jgi:hypothetical protein
MDMAACLYDVGYAHAMACLIPIDRYPEAAPLKFKRPIFGYTHRPW